MALVHIRLVKFPFAGSREIIQGVGMIVVTTVPLRRSVEPATDSCPYYPIQSSG